MKTENETTAATEQGKRRHYWLREDFEELMSVIPEIDRPGDGAKTTSFTLVYPKFTEGAVAELKLRGLNCTEKILEDMAKADVVTPKLMAGSKHIFQWDRADIDAAADWFDDRACWTSWTHFCWTANLRFGQAVKAHRVFCALHGYGFQLSFDVLGVVTVIDPSPECEGYAHVRFFPAGTKFGH